MPTILKEHSSKYLKKEKIALNCNCIEDTPYKEYMFAQKLRIFLLVICLTALALESKAQYFTISGFVSDKNSNEMLIGAYVFCPQTGTGCVTNNYGYYAITVPYGTKNILYLNEGYFALIDTTVINANKHVDISLRMMDEYSVQTNPFENIKIESDETEEVDTAERSEDDTTYVPKRATIKNSKQIDDLIRHVLATNFKIIDRIESGYLEVPGFQISKMPSLGGEIDVGRSIKHLPGIMPGTELTNGMYVRGGGQDQNLVLIDGMPIYNMNHAFGFYSIFNSEGINSINITKSGYSARNGGRLSAITDVVMKEGNSGAVHGIFLNSLVGLTLNLDGPLSADGRTTFSIAARRSDWDLLFLRAISTKDNKFIYTFYDLNVKVCHRIDKKNKLFFSVYSNRDRLYIFNRFKDTISDTASNVSYLTTNSSGMDIRWGNFATSVKWNKVVNPKLFSNLSLSYSQYKSEISLLFTKSIDSANSKDNSEINFKYYNYIRDITGRADYDYMLDRKNTLHFGAFLSLKYFAPGATATKYNHNGSISNDTSFGASKAIPTQEIAAYLENEYHINNDTKLTYGGRVVTYFQKSDKFLFFEPRISLNKKINNRYALKASYTVMNQNLHLLGDNINSNILALNFDRWIPASKVSLPQRAQQITLGISQPFKNNVELSVEGYYKWFNRVLEVKEGADINGGILTGNDWEDKVLTGKGQNYGLEAFLQKRRGDLTGWIGYSLAWAIRNTPGVNRDQNYYFQFDRRHYLNIVAQAKIDDTYTGSINIVFSTGNVQSVPIGKYLDNNGNIVYDYTEKNNYRLPNTFRIDVGLTKIRDRSWGSESGWRFSIYNVLARNNPAYIYIDNSGKNPQAYQRGFLGFIPGLTYFTKF